MTTDPMAMKFSVLDATGREVPWGNGIDVSREIIARHEAGALLWRLSTTRIRQSCDFSDYQGYDRTITLLAGGPFQLEFGEHAPDARVEQYRPCRFSGGWPAYCRLLGDTASVINVMVADGLDYAVSTTSFTDAESPLALGVGVTLVHCLQGDLAIATPDGARHAVAREETFAAEGRAGGDLRIRAADGTAQALVFRLEGRL